MITSFSVPFTNNLIDSSESIWINMEQKSRSDYDTNNGNISLNDILNMDTMSRLNVTAFRERFIDGVYFTDGGNIINIPLSFYVFPSSIDLPYTIQVADAVNVSARVLVNIDKTQNIIIPLTNEVTLKALIQNASNFSWQIPCYNANGEIVSIPEYSIQNNNIVLDASVFGVLRGDFSFIGYEHMITLRYQKSQTTEINPIPNVFGLRELVINQTTYNRITEAGCTVLCSYIDINGETQQEKLELKVPETILNYLKECPSSAYTGGDWSEDGSPMARINWNDEVGESGDLGFSEAGSSTKYYSACDGSSMGKW